MPKKKEEPIKRDPKEREKAIKEFEESLAKRKKEKEEEEIRESKMKNNCKDCGNPSDEDYCESCLWQKDIEAEIERVGYNKWLEGKKLND